MTEPLTVVVPAHNEAATIGRVIEHLIPQPWVGEVLVVDNGSTDDTAEVARAAGARTVREDRPGMGHAVRAGLGAAKHDWVMKVDADLDRFDMSRFANMAAARAPGVGLIKGNWQDPNDNMPMTRLLVMPAVAQLAPGLRDLKAPNSGIYVVNRTCIAHQEIVGTYAADLDVMLRVYASGAAVDEVDIGRISHDTRDVGHYNAMADVIMAFFLDCFEKRLAHEIVLTADTAEDVIRSALGFVAGRARAGASVTLYLEHASGPAADVLRAVLAPFPTVRILPLDLAAMYAPRGPATEVCLIAPYPSAEKTAVLRAALDMQARLQSDGVMADDLLLMPPASKLGVLRNFKADHAFDIGEGAGIKTAALGKLASPVGETGGSAATSRETFQSYGSLPEALRRDVIGPTTRAEA